MNGTCISLRGVHKSFEAPDGGRPLLAVDGVDPEINSGEIVALLGPNGAGKTTTLDMVLGFTTRTAGSISVFGRSPREAIVEGRIAAVLQTGGLLRDLTVRETVELVASTQTNPMHPDEALERGGLTTQASRQVQACSGVNNRGCGSPWPYSATPTCWCWTNRPPAWTLKVAESSGKRCTPKCNGAEPSSSPPATSKRPKTSPNARF